MCGAVSEALPSADALIMAAAPADFGAAAPAAEKIKKRDAPSHLDLSPTPDILLATRGQRRPGTIIVGFALETTDVLSNAREKLAAKALDLVVVNDATESGAGFGVDTNRVTLLGADGTAEEVPLMRKDGVADAILDRIEALLRGR
jgi:phosphopantothenoylcysteine decarboxylase / phosphopantothenate---cysteine ligase